MKSIDPLDSSILCRAAFALPATATGEFMYMPGGLQSITPFDGGIGQPIKVLVDAAGAAALEAQRTALVARGKKAFFDFNHADGPASFWPDRFVYREEPVAGIYCSGEWSASGKASVEGKEWRQFSPVFHVDDKRGNPARIVCRDRAKPNMGGLVNDPAFHQILPLWAKDAPGAHPDQPNQIAVMTKEELAALQAEIQGLRNQLSAKAGSDDAAALTAALKAKEGELQLATAQAELKALQAKNEEQEKAITARNKSDAEAAVKEAVQRGAIAAKDEKTQQTLIATATADPSFISAIAAMQGNTSLATRLTPGAGSVRIIAEAPNAILKAYGAVLARNASLPLSHQTYQQKGDCAREAAEIFAKDIDKNADFLGLRMEEALKAADFSDPNNNLGLLSGTLVLQKTLSLLQFEYPILSSVFTDFSDAPGLWQQTEVTRIVLTPAVQTYDPTADASGRPKGWTTVSPAQTVNVPITLDEYVGVPIVFGNTTLASTTRNLFGEVANQALYSIGGYFVRKLLGLFTAANYNAYAGTSAAAGATTSGSAAITVTSTAGMYPGQLIAGTGIPANTFVLSVTNGTTAVLNNQATATNTGLTFTLGSAKVPTTYATYVKAAASFTAGSLGDIGAAFDNNEVPSSDRNVMLNAAYWQALRSDPNLVNFMAWQQPGILTKGELPEINGFTPRKAPYFPTSSNRTGFAYHKSAAALKSRLPMDVTAALGVAAPGSVSTITDPATGLSLALVQRVDLGGMYAEWRPEVMIGAAVGERRAGLVITSA
jgi:hypothetical protein